MRSQATYSKSPCRHWAPRWPIRWHARTEVSPSAAFAHSRTPNYSYGGTMKSFIQSMLVAAAALLVACSGGEPKSGAEDGGAKPIVLGFSQIGAESEWRTANTRSIQEAAPAAGITLKFSDAQQKQENQIKALRSFIAQRVDVIAFSPVVETGWETVLREAKAAAIPVIITDRAVDVPDESLYLSLIGSDFVEEGRKAGRWLLEKTKDRPGDINIVELQGTVGSAPANDRKRGFQEIIAADPRYKVIRSQTGDFTRAKGKEVMEAFLKAAGKPIPRRMVTEEGVFPKETAAQEFPKRKY